MTLQEFKESTAAKKLPEGLTVTLQALWHDTQGDWDKAHQLAQSVNAPDGAWVHAYLHRKEGDLANASYWYSRASKQVPEISLEEEWQEIAADLLERQEEAQQSQREVGSG